MARNPAPKTAAAPAQPPAPTDAGKDDTLPPPPAPTPNPPAQSVAQAPVPAAIYSLSLARGLPAPESDDYTEFESDDPNAVLAFKDEDGTTKRVVHLNGHLAAVVVAR